MSVQTATGSPSTLKTDDFVVAAASSSARSAASTSCQYKRGQMERRVRTWTERRGTADLADYGERLRRDAGELDAFLDRVTINVSQLWRHPEQWSVAAHARSCPSWPSAGRAARLERRLLLRRRGLHARRDLPRGDPDAPASRSSAPTSTSAWSPAPARATSPPRTPAPRPKRCCSAISSRSPDGGWRASRELTRMVRFENGRPAAHAGARRGATTSSSAATPSSTSPRRCATRCTSGSSRRSRPAATSSSAPPSASPTRAGSASRRPHHFIYRKS